MMYLTFSEKHDFFIKKIFLLYILLKIIFKYFLKFIKILLNTKWFHI